METAGAVGPWGAMIQNMPPLVPARGALLSELY